mmetsp:Transcript_27101/g.40038  ORF Transcript_27101/g.40038 Transcript_27101/m.40038 type:complete len:299 (-) Transcript_27101:271-1167(-)
MNTGGQGQGHLISTHHTGIHHHMTSPREFLHHIHQRIQCRGRTGRTVPRNTLRGTGQSSSDAIIRQTSFIMRCTAGTALLGQTCTIIRYILLLIIIVAKGELLIHVPCQHLTNTLVDWSTGLPLELIAGRIPLQWCIIIVTVDFVLIDVCIAVGRVQVLLHHFGHIFESLDNIGVGVGVGAFNGHHTTFSIGGLHLHGSNNGLHRILHIYHTVSILITITITMNDVIMTSDSPLRHTIQHIIGPQPGTIDPSQPHTNAAPVAAHLFFFTVTVYPGHHLIHHGTHILHIPQLGWYNGTT